ncbi:hypothetical protein [Paenibacillus eucommiae]|uniref:Uncharacterized protein n=1 Tax=Paenibacillus eucommiae TaxID=1355755 RepID=A0ABS4INR8_9BACL|nr:hypothetical protein [Paenibacillus eucommiae]MBP1989192.1 hypothetical protein [Paenibacillus eucommiae]
MVVNMMNGIKSGAEPESAWPWIIAFFILGAIILFISWIFDNLNALSDNGEKSLPLYKPGFILSTDAQFKEAINNRSNVIVYQSGEILDYGGPIESQTEIAVTIAGNHYLKTICEFRIRYW